MSQLELLMIDSYFANWRFDCLGVEIDGIKVAKPIGPTKLENLAKLFYHTSSNKSDRVSSNIHLEK